MIVGASAHKQHNFEDNNPLKTMLLDFGLAKDFEDSIGQGLTKAGVAMGTPMYMSPEQCAGKAVDERSEVYSVGCLMYELLTGVYPLKGDTALETISLHQDTDAPSLNESNCGIEFEEELELIVAKTLEKEPSKRFANMEELKLEVQVILGKDVDFLESYSDDSQDDSDDETIKPFSLEPDSGKKSNWASILISASVLFALAGLALGYRLLALNNVDTSSKKKLPNMEFSFLSPDPNTAFTEGPGDSGIVFSMFNSRPNTKDSEVTSIDPKSLPKILSLCEQKEITNTSYEYAANQPLVGIGLNGVNLTGNQLELFTKTDSKLLEIIWMKDNPEIKDEDLAFKKSVKPQVYQSCREQNYR